jgi:hypothetical protein
MTKITTIKNQCPHTQQPSSPLPHHPMLEDPKLDQKVSLRASLEARHRSDRPLLLRQGPPFCWNPITHQPAVPSAHHQPTACRPCPIAVGLPHPCKHGRLTVSKPVFVEFPGLHPQLLPVLVPHLEDPILGKQGICMIVATLSRNNAHKPYLPQRSPSPSDSTGGVAEPYYRVIQVKRPITKLYSWAQGGCREEGRVLPIQFLLQFFVSKI